MTYIPADQETISALEEGWKVSVTLTDGTKVRDSPITRVGRNLLICDGSIVLGIAHEAINTSKIDSLDAFTPPEPPNPWWDRFGMGYVIDRDNDLWWRADGDEWRIARGGIYLTSGDVEAKYGPCVPLIRVEVTDEMVAAAEKSWSKSAFSYDPDRARAALMAALEAALGIEAHE